MGGDEAPREHQHHRPAAKSSNSQPGQSAPKNPSMPSTLRPDASSNYGANVVVRLTVKRLGRPRRRLLYPHHSAPYRAGGDSSNTSIRQTGLASLPSHRLRANGRSVGQPPAPSSAAIGNKTVAIRALHALQPRSRPFWRPDFAQAAECMQTQGSPDNLSAARSAVSRSCRTPYSIAKEPRSAAIQGPLLGSASVVPVRT